MNLIDATDVPHHLAEGPFWDPVRERLLWVDIMAGDVLVGRLGVDDRIEVDERVTFPDTAGAVAVSAAGEWVVAGKHRLHHRTSDGRMLAGPALIDGARRRFNDGAPDPAGRFLVGTKGDGEELLMQVDVDGAARVIDDDLGLSNGLAWSADGRTLFSVDTPSRRIFARDYDPETGATGERRLFTTIEEGFPDGMTTDAEDHLWVAIWGGGCVLRVDGTGAVVTRIDVPAPHVTCPVFAGPELDVLVITTATEDMPPDELRRHPLAGRLFTCRPGVRGNPPHLWAGIPHDSGRES